MWVRTCVPDNTDYREENGLKRAVGSVWRISHGALPKQAYAQQIGQK
jgi:hypothetical protein